MSKSNLGKLGQSKAPTNLVNPLRQNSQNIKLHSKTPEKCVSAKLALLRGPDKGFFC